MDDTDHKNRLPTVVVQWPACPHCGYENGRRTFATTGKTRRIIGTTTMSYAKCCRCQRSIRIEHATAW